MYKILSLKMLENISSREAEFILFKLNLGLLKNSKKRQKVQDLILERLAKTKLMRTEYFMPSN